MSDFNEVKMRDSARIELAIKGENPIWELQCITSDGTGGATLHINWNATLWQAYDETIDAWTERVYKEINPENTPNQTISLREMSRQLGRMLFEKIIIDGVNALFKQLWKRLESRDIRELQIALDLKSDVLVNIPWELLFDPDGIGFLATFPGIALVRYVSTGSAYASLVCEGRPRLLATIAQPNGYPIQDYSQRTYLAPLQSLKRQNKIELSVASGEKTMDQIKMLKSRSINILDIISHGGFYGDDGEFYFMFEGKKRIPERVAISTLRGRLFEWGLTEQVKLVFVKSCFSGAGSADSLAGNVGTALAQLNVPAVIGMRFRIATAVALDLSREFYRSLGEHGLVTQALREARQAVNQTYDRTVDWAIPTLTMRCSDSKLIEISDVSDNLAIYTELLNPQNPSEGYDTRISSLKRRLASSPIQDEAKSIRHELRHLERKQDMDLKLERTKNLRQRKNLAYDLAVWVDEIIGDLRTELNHGRGTDQFFHEMCCDALDFIDRSLEIDRNARYYLVRAKFESEINNNYEKALISCRAAIDNAPGFEEPYHQFVDYAEKIIQEANVSDFVAKQLKREITNALKKLKEIGVRINERLAHEYLGNL